MDRRIRRTAEYGTPDSEELATKEAADYAKMIEGLISFHGYRIGEDGLVRPPVRALRGLLKSAKAAPEPPKDDLDVPLARQRALLAAYEHPSNSTSKRRGHRLLFVVSALLFAAAGGLVWGWQSGLILFGVVLIHELGHFLVMRKFGYRDLGIVLVPFLGGAALGSEQDPRVGRRVLVSLAGPLPGILIGWGLALAAYHTLINDGSIAFYVLLQSASTTFLTLNYINLLPIPPLDGSRIIEALLPRGWFRVEVVVMGVAALAGVLAAYRLKFPALGLLLLWYLSGRRSYWRDSRLATQLRAQFGGEVSTCPMLDVHVLKALGVDKEPGSMTSRFERVIRLRKLITPEASDTRLRLALLALYLSPFILPFLLPSWARLGLYWRFQSLLVG